MSYTKHNWVDYPDETTLVTAQKLNEMEQGIYDANEKGGTNVVANPDELGYTKLSKLKVNDTVYNVTGTQVIANPITEPERVLNKVFIEDTTYSLPSGGGGGGADPNIYAEKHIQMPITGAPATASGEGAIGIGATATGVTSFAQGGGCNATGVCSFAHGGGCTASGAYSFAEGGGCNAVGSGSIAMGSGCNAYGENSFATGNGTTTGVKGTEQGSCAHAEGGGTSAIGAQSHAEGGGTTASGSQAHSEGASTTAAGSQSHSEGAATSVSPQGPQGHAEGNETFVDAAQGHAEGYKTKVYAAQAHAEGNENIIYVSATQSHAEGIGNGMWGYQSHAEGAGNKVYGKNSHVEGAGNTTGDVNYPNGYDSSKETYNNVGDYAHAEGSGTTAYGTNSHSEGGGTRAVGRYSHAEGTGTTAQGDVSHAEGAGNTASGSCSHVGGSGSLASGALSFAHGGSVTAGYSNQTVFGQFNDNQPDNIFEIGNGSSDSSTGVTTHKNVFAVTRDGDIHFRDEDDNETSLRDALASGGGGGGTTDYTKLSNKPKINNVELTGDKSLEDLDINIPTKVADLDDADDYAKATDIINVEANPEDEATDSLTKIKIGEDIYSIEGGSGSDIEYLTQADYDARKKAGTLDNDKYYATPSRGGGGSSESYSTDEQVIGTWLGKPLYQKTWLFDNVTKGAHDYDYIGELNLDWLVDVKATYKNASSGSILPNYSIGTSDYACAYIGGGTVLRINVNSNMSKVSVTLKYTKTTD